MAKRERKFKESDLEVKDNYRELNAEEVCGYASPEHILTETFFLLEFPKIVAKITVSPYLQNLCVSVDPRYKEKIALPDAQDLVDLSNEFYDVTAVTKLYLDENGEIIFEDSSGDLKLVHVDTADFAEELTLEKLVKLSVDKTFSLSDYCLITAEGDAKYLRDGALSKFFVPHMFDWLTIKYPNLLAPPKMSQDIIKMSEAGFYTMLASFISQNYGYAPITGVFFPEAVIPSLFVSEMLDTNLYPRLQATQLKDISIRINNILDKDVIKNVRAKNPPVAGFFPPDCITDMDSFTKDQDFIKHEIVTWSVFLNCHENFPLGCTVIFAPSQIITDDNDELIFVGDDVGKIKYYGNSSPNEDRRNTAVIVQSSNTLNNTKTDKLRKYLEEELNIKVSGVYSAGAENKVFPENKHKEDKPNEIVLP